MCMPQINASFNLGFDYAAHDMSDHVIYDHVKFSDSGCQSDCALFEAYSTYMHNT